MKHNERSGKHVLFIPMVHYDSCTGCGKYKQACIMEELLLNLQWENAKNIINWAGKRRKNQETS